MTKGGEISARKKPTTTESRNTCSHTEVPCIQAMGQVRYCPGEKCRSPQVLNPSTIRTHHSKKSTRHQTTISPAGCPRSWNREMGSNSQNQEEPVILSFETDSETEDDFCVITYRVPSGLPIKCGIFPLKMWDFKNALIPIYDT